MVDRPTDLVIISRFTVFTGNETRSDNGFNVLGGIGGISGVSCQVASIAMMCATKPKSRCFERDEEGLVESFLTISLDVLLASAVKSKLNLGRVHRKL